MPPCVATGGPSYLVLGWKTDEAGNPVYWQRSDANPGGYAEGDIFRVKAANIGCHTAVIAQSGSGKSFFMGRLVEEILLRTRARCVVLDPNADFRRVDQVEGDALWKNPSWSGQPRQKRFTHEADRDEFANRWAEQKVRILMGRGASNPRQETLKLWWPRVPAQLLARDLSPVDRSDFFYCHRVLDLLGDLLDLRAIDHSDNIDLEHEAIRLFSFARKRGRGRIRAFIERRYGMRALAAAAQGAGEQPAPNTSASLPENEVNRMVERLGDMAVGIRAYVSAGVERFYFGKIREYRAAGILQEAAQSPGRRRTRNFQLEVVDLPSVEESIRTEAVGALIKTEWTRARDAWESSLKQASQAKLGEAPPQDQRVPTFIVVDEAHNLIPADVSDTGQAALREDFRRIVAEGRKFGLFLIFVSQRPDKLDPLIFSECENKAVMRLTSQQVIESTRKMMGLEELPEERLRRCREFGPGRALLIGKWCEKAEGEIIYAAARRTIEGGGNLDEKHWATPPAADQGEAAKEPPGP